jgi:hypothetical protein
MENHDTHRFNHLYPDVRKYFMAMGILATIRGIPQLYYGSEIGMNGNKDNGDADIRKDFPGGWEEDTQNAFTPNVTQTPTSLTADRTLVGTTYQWLDCDNSNAPISGQTAQTFIPTVSGNYAVRLISNGCQSVSDCYSFTFLSTPDFNLNASVSVYPNPTTGMVLITNSELITIKRVGIYSVLGTLVTNTLDITGRANGIYIIKIETDKGTKIKKISKN